jgi:hypothetical protein
MKLENKTPIPADLTIAEAPHLNSRIGLLTAKATFTFDAAGRVELDSQTQFPLLSNDVPTPLGPLPSDNRARRGEKFEVMLLGMAHPPRPAASVLVALTVGSERRQLLVVGDRVWLGDDSRSAFISQTSPFESMPLVYERAFGGTAAVEIDATSVLDISHPINPKGRGFDPNPQAHGLAQLLGVPPGFPRLPPGPRALPNIENPRAPIVRWQDAPDPVGWAPAPLDSGIAFLEIIKARSARVAQMQQEGSYSPEKFQEEEAARAEREDDVDLWIYRAHPDWVISLPPAGALVRLEHLIAGVPVVELRLPQLNLVADYTLYGRLGQRPLRPQALVLLPQEQRFYLVYRFAFNFEPGPAHERSFRLRSEVGWPEA